jgi:hypothetical protein
MSTTDGVVSEKGACREALLVLHDQTKIVRTVCHV